MFDYILARSRTRESSTLTIATVASSASLILLVLYMQAPSVTCSSCQPTLLSPYAFAIIYFGMVFAIVGILYREVTKYTIHGNDERWLKACAKKCSKECLNLEDKEGRTIPNPLYYCDGSRLREGILRALLVIPIIAWSFIIDHTYVIISNTFDKYFLMIALILNAMYVLLSTYLDRKD